MKKKLKRFNRKNADSNDQKSLSSNFDVNGSYTGTPAYNDNSAPTQDVDDL